MSGGRMHKPRCRYFDITDRCSATVAVEIPSLRQDDDTWRAKSMTVGFTVLVAACLLCSGVVQARPPLIAQSQLARDSDGDGVANVRDACPETPLAQAVDSLGCRYPQGELAVVEFESADASLDAGDRARLVPVAALLRQHAQLHLIIDGHADGVGDDQGNLGLSRRRSASVAAQLVRLGVPAARVHLVAHGESTPIADGRKAAGRAANRRVSLRTADW